MIIFASINTQSYQVKNTTKVHLDKAIALGLLIWNRLTHIKLKNSFYIMDVIVLVGGLGTRLKGVISDVPKPMAPVGGAPFLDILLNQLLCHSVIERVVMAVGYKREVVQNYFGDRAYNRKIIYAIEKEPLGTGGGIHNALAHTRSAEVLVVNGDTSILPPWSKATGSVRRL